MLKEKKSMESMNFDSRKYLNGGGVKPYKLGVFGSRSLFDERVKTIILEKIIELQATMIITAKEPQGVCEVAQEIAKAFAYPLQLHFLNMQYLRGAFEQRSKEIIHESDFLLIIHDGTSAGTKNEKILCEKSKKPFYYVVLEPSKYTQSVGFEITTDWTYSKDENWQNLKKDF